MTQRCSIRCINYNRDSSNSKSSNCSNKRSNWNSCNKYSSSNNTTNRRSITEGRSTRISIDNQLETTHPQQGCRELRGHLPRRQLQQAPSLVRTDALRLRVVNGTSPMDRGLWQMSLCVASVKSAVLNWSVSSVPSSSVVRAQRESIGAASCQRTDSRLLAQNPSFRLAPPVVKSVVHTLKTNTQPIR